MNVYAADFMAQDTALSFDADTALNAALYSTKYQLALADSLILQIMRKVQTENK